VSPLVVRVVAVVVFAFLVVLFIVFRPSPTKGVTLGVIHSSAYGNVLDVTSGPLAGFPLYEFSGDAPQRPGCGTTRARGYDLNPNGSLEMTCTGPMSDMLNDVTSDDWPALTSSLRALAGPGVRQDLIGTITRAGVGKQVTYAGHPLYLFDPSSAPFRPLGEDYPETVKPFAPWHGYWTLVAARNGQSDPGRALIELDAPRHGERVLAVQVDPNVSPFAMSVFTYSKGLCSHCAPTWVPVLTNATPLVRGVDPSSVGTRRLRDGALQVTYENRPLYEYARQTVQLKSDGSPGTTGLTGANARLDGGTFSPVKLAN
jgi:predicted lipoprotein with Yx(FWY)xxD motif